MTLIIPRPSRFIQWLSTLLLVIAITGWFLLYPPTTQAAGTVTHCTDDNTAGSLRTALAGGGTVTFGVDCTPLNLALTAVAGTHIQITANTEINANGHTVELRGNGNRIFQLERGDNLTLIGLRITNGSTTGNGGAIEVISGANDGQITIQDSEFVNNSAGDSGGAIYIPYSVNNPDVRIERSVFIGNSVTNAGSNKGGGAIYAYGPLTFQIINSTFTGNSSASSPVLFTRSCLIIWSALNGKRHRGTRSGKQMGVTRYVNSTTGFDRLNQQFLGNLFSWNFLSFTGNALFKPLEKSSNPIMIRFILTTKNPE